LYNICIESLIPMKHVNLIKMCLNETYSRAQVGQRLSQWQMLSRHCFSTLFGICYSGGSYAPGWLEIKWYTSAKYMVMSRDQNAGEVADKE